MPGTPFDSRVIRLLGRPLAPFERLDPAEIEARIAELWNACKESARRSRPLRVAAGWQCETALYQVLSSVLARASSHRRLKVALAGSPFLGLTAPPRPSCDVACLLEAPLFESLEEWESVPPGTAVILAGRAADWPHPPDFTLRLHTPSATAKTVRLARERFLPAPDTEQACALISALGCDVAAEAFASGNLLHPVEDEEGRPQRWLSVPGPWVLLEALRDLPALPWSAVYRWLAERPENRRILRRAGILSNIGHDTPNT